MRVILLQEPSYQFLLNVLADFTRGGGVGLDNLEDMSILHKSLAGAKDIDFSKLGKVDLEKIGPSSVTLGIPDERDKNYCPDCIAFLPSEEHKPMCRIRRLITQTEESSVQAKEKV